MTRCARSPALLVVVAILAGLTACAPAASHDGAPAVRVPLHCAQLFSRVAVSRLSDGPVAVTEK